MSSGTYEHWAEDDDTLEAYVLGRTGPQHKSDMERHLEECSACRERVHSEMALAEGVRRFAREEMRDQLQDRLTAPNKVIPWPRVFSIAAAIVAVVGLAIYGRWFSSDRPEPVGTERAMPDSIAMDQSLGEESLLPATGTTEQPGQEDASEGQTAAKLRSGQVTEEAAPAIRTKPLVLRAVRLASLPTPLGTERSAEGTRVDKAAEHAPRARQKSGTSPAYPEVLVSLKPDPRTVATLDSTGILCHLETIGGTYHLTMFVAVELASTPPDQVQTEFITGDSLLVRVAGNAYLVPLPGSQPNKK
jgi:hypothetical protein